MLAWLEPMVLVIGIGVIGVGAMVGTLNLAHGLIALIRLVGEPRAQRSLPPRLWRELEPLAPSLSIVVPAHNEAATIEASVRAMLAVEYPGLSLVIVNDGSQDATVETAVRAFGLREVPLDRLVRARDAAAGHRADGPNPTPDPTAAPALLRHQPVRRVFEGPGILLIDKDNGGKADALNAGILAAETDCVCVVDADTLPERTAMMAALQPFLEEPGEVLAVGGAIRIGNGLTIDHGHISSARPPGRLLPLLQTVEYLRTFHAARTAMGSLGAVGLISGAFGVFDRAALIEVGGYERRTVGEDYELVMRLHRLAARRGLADAVRYRPDAVAWTEAPETLASLSRQRRRWQRGALETILRHGAMIGRRRFGAVGLLALPEALLVDVAAPVATVLGYLVLPLAVVLGILSPSWLVAFFILTTGLGLLHSAFGLALEDLRFRRFAGHRAWLVLLGASVVEVFGYRQLCDWWRVRGMIDWLSGATGWGAMPRLGFRRAGDTQVETAPQSVPVRGGITP
jgi:cellulose synthase/poly-beta-1,6-N-acetylglucosamine synthase-like glycosyltransferase